MYIVAQEIKPPSQKSNYWTSSVECWLHHFLFCAMQQTGRRCGLCSISGASEPYLKWQTVHQHYSLSSLKSVSEHKCHCCGSLLMPLLGCCTLLGNFDWPISPVVALLLPGYSKSHASVSCTSAPGSQAASTALTQPLGFAVRTDAGTCEPGLAQRWILG